MVSHDHCTITNLRHKTDMDVTEVLWSHCKLELSKCLNKWHPLYVSYCTTKLNGEEHKDILAFLIHVKLTYVVWIHIVPWNETINFITKLISLLYCFVICTYVVFIYCMCMQLVIYHICIKYLPQWHKLVVSAHYHPLVS